MSPRVKMFGGRPTRATQKRRRAGQHPGLSRGEQMPHTCSAEAGVSDLRSSVRLPVHISLTTTSWRAGQIAPVIDSLLCQTFAANDVTLYVSSEAHMLDEGLKFSEDVALRRLLEAHALSQTRLYIETTPNIGPHRKLLPALHKYRNEDCLIVTIDDDRVVHPSWLERLMSEYLRSDGLSIIAGRAVQMRPSCQASKHGRPSSRSAMSLLAEYAAFPLVWGNRTGKLLMPIGAGGVVYRPRFLHPIVSDKNYRQAAAWNDDISFRFASLLYNISVRTAR